MRKNNKLDSWKQLDKELLDPIADKLTAFLEYMTPERKELKRKPSSEETELDSYDDREKLRKARYEALKQKSMD